MQVSSELPAALPGSPAQPFSLRLLLVCRWSAAALDFLAMVSMQVVFAREISGRGAGWASKQAGKLVRWPGRPAFCNYWGPLRRIERALWGVGASIFTAAPRTVLRCRRQPPAAIL